MELKTIARGTVTNPAQEDTWRKEIARIVAYPEDVGWTRQQAQRLARRLAEERAVDHHGGVRRRRPTLGPRPTTVLEPPKPTERPRVPRPTRSPEPEAPRVEVWTVGWRGTPMLVGTLALLATVGVFVVHGAASLLVFAAVVGWVGFAASLRAPYELIVDRNNRKLVVVSAISSGDYLLAEVVRLVEYRLPSDGEWHHFEICLPDRSVTVPTEVEARFAVIRSLVPTVPVTREVYQPDAD